MAFDWLMDWLSESSWNQLNQHKTIGGGHCEIWNLLSCGRLLLWWKIKFPNFPLIFSIFKNFGYSIFPKFPTFPLIFFGFSNFTNFKFLYFFQNFSKTFPEFSILFPNFFFLISCFFFWFFYKFFKKKKIFTRFF